MKPAFCLKVAGLIAALLLTVGCDEDDDGPEQIDLGPGSVGYGMTGDARFPFMLASKNGEVLLVMATTDAK